MVAVGFELCDGFPSSGGNLVATCSVPTSLHGVLVFALGPVLELRLSLSTDLFQIRHQLTSINLSFKLISIIHHISPVLVVPHAEVSKTGNL
jgi:hypothetical protein